MKPELSLAEVLATPSRKTLIRYLDQECILPRELSEALIAEHRRSDGPFIGLMLRRGLLQTTEGLDLAASVLGVPRIEDLNDRVDFGALQLLPESIARKQRVLPIELSDGWLLLAMEDPSNRDFVHELERSSGLHVRPALVSAPELNMALGHYGGISGELTHFLHSQRQAGGEVRYTDRTRRRESADIADAPVVRLVDRLLIEAIRGGASDIHVEPTENAIRIRLRVDGSLQDFLELPRRDLAALVNRLKVLAEMNIADRRLPQDGRIGVEVDGRAVDVRANTVPGIHGEKVVLRLLDHDLALLGLEELGFDPKQLDAFLALIRRPHGLVLVTGPTGSGKSTTLYSTLARLAEESRNITTIEDPVEHRLDGVTQIQVNHDAGVTFSSGLKALFRQDPDVIMVGEMRDADAARDVARMGLTGHLVFSTLHSLNAVGAIPRLIDLGIEPQLVASVLTGVVAQRLVRRICPDCRETYRPELGPLRAAGLALPDDATFYRGKGCPSCEYSGYRGRTLILEILCIDEPMRRAIIESHGSDALRRAALRSGLVEMPSHGIRKILAGETTPDEIRRVLLGL